MFDGWSVDETGRELSIWFLDSTVYGVLRLFTSETDAAVHVLAVDGGKPLPGMPPPFHDGGAYCPKRWVAHLKAPLGERTVFDTATGRPSPAFVRRGD
jgi:hypothetical protein